MIFFFFLKILLIIYKLFFFFQAEDGIRDLYVTGVQTCALPISFSLRFAGQMRASGPRHYGCSRQGEEARLRPKHRRRVRLTKQPVPPRQALQDKPPMEECRSRTGRRYL